MNAHLTDGEEIEPQPQSDARTVELEELSRRDVENDAGRAVRVVELRIPEDLAYFDGHFDGDPVLPGVVQLNTVALAHVETRWPELGHLEGTRRLKFIRPLRPGDTITLYLERKSAPRQVGLVIKKGDETCTTTTLLFAEGSDT
jgi:3-hydroxymyristoyl/3-hydroxydecanoyl-(acyl carrier protein) dehydratase